MSERLFGRIDALGEVLAFPITTPSAAIQVTGSALWNGTLVFESSVDGANYSALRTIRQADDVIVTSTTASGVFLVANPGYSHIRVRCSVYVAGTATVAISGGESTVSPQMSAIATSQIATLVQAGQDAVAGTVRVFPATTTSGHLDLSIDDQAGDTEVSLVIDGMGQATVVTLPDPGIAASFLVQSTLAMTPEMADELPKIPTAQSTVTPAVPAGTTQEVDIQLNDADGTALAGVHLIEVYMATDAAGATPSVAGANTSVTATTGAVLREDTPLLHWRILTDATGLAQLTFDNAGGGGPYTDRVVLVLPNGALVVSAALAVPNA